MLNRNTTPQELATACSEFALALYHGTEASAREAHYRLRDVMNALYWPSMFDSAAVQPAAAPHQHGGRPMTLRECMEAEEPAASLDLNAPFDAADRLRERQQQKADVEASAKAAEFYRSPEFAEMVQRAADKSGDAL